MLPEFASAICNLAAALRDLGKLQEAESHFQHALRFRPDLAAAHFGLGRTYYRQRKLDLAIDCYRRTVELSSDDADAYAELAAALFDQQRFTEAVANLRRATALRPNSALLQANLGLALHFQGYFPAALGASEKAILDPACRSLALWNRSLTLLLLGRFDQGWQEYESRWIAGDEKQPEFKQPRWTGEPLSAKTILLWAEQGFGDTFQFARYAQLLRDHGARVVLQCQRPLVNILSRTPGVDQLIAAGDPLPPFDFHIPFLSAPRILKTRLETIPANVPYIFPDPALIGYWRARLTQTATKSSTQHSPFLIGINWGGRPGIGAQRQRDIPLAQFQVLATVPGVTLISLQKGEPLAELRNSSPAFPMIDLGDEIDTAHGAFMDTAAVMKNLDLIITSDTSIAHLAGAIAVRTWLALPYVPDWRWLLNRTDSPWYPTLRLFRQPISGDWTTVFQDIRSALTTFLA